MSEYMDKFRQKQQRQLHLNKLKNLIGGTIVEVDDSTGVPQIVIEKPKPHGQKGYNYTTIEIPFK
jgi:hypothetical protein